MNRAAARLLLPMVWGLTGCAAAPVHYYTLVPAGAGAASLSPVAPWRVEVRIGRLPAPLDRTAMVVRSSSTELEVLENERWSSSLRDELRDSLRIALQADLDNAGAPATAVPALEVVISVDRLEGTLGQAVILDAAWTARAPPGIGPAPVNNPLSCGRHAVQTVGNGTAALVAGYQSAIREWAAAIVAALRSGACS